MSRHSKLKRQARLKREGSRPIRRLGAPLQPHATLTDEAGNVVGLMPHPERTSSPLLGSSDGVVMLESLLAAAAARV